MVKTPSWNRWPARLALVTVGLLFLALSIHKVYAVDYWWQLATGRWIVDNAAWPDVDVFSYTAAGHEWIELRWLFCIAAYGLWRLGGAALLILVKTAILGAAFVIVSWPWRRSLVTPSAILALALGVFAASDRFVVRPEIVSYLLIAVFLLSLNRLHRNGSLALVGLLVALQVIWVNAHTLFVLGPVLVWIFLLGDVGQRLLARLRSAKAGPLINRSLLVSAVGVTGACIVNPYGLRGALFPLMLFRQIQPGGLLAGAIVEFRSPFLLTLWPGFLWAAAAVALFGVFSFVLNRRRFDVTRSLVFVAFLYLACVSIRNVSLFALVATWTTLGNLHGFATKRAADESAPTRMRTVAHLAIAAALLAGSWYVASDRYSLRQGSLSYFGLGVSEEQLPRAATRFLLESGAQGQLYHEMADGSYLIWEARDRYRVFIDPRLEVYAGEPMSRYLSVSGRRWNGVDEWNRFAATHGINTALLMRRYDRNLIPTLQEAPDWGLVHVDPRNVVFVKNVTEHVDLLRRHRIRLDHSWTSPETIPDEAPRGWRRLLGAVGRPWYSFEMAKMLILLNAADHAGGFLERGLERFPDHEEMRWTLAQIHRSQGRAAEAAELMSGLDLSPEVRTRADRLLATLLVQERRLNEAIPMLRRVLDARPGDASSLDLLARALFATGDSGAATEAFGRLARLRPADPETWSSYGLAAERAGRESEAMQAYRRVLEIDPDRYQVHNQLGILLAKRGDRVEARRHLERALAIRPDYEAARRNLDRLNTMN